MKPLARKTVIAGVGLIGGSLAAAAKRAGSLQRIVGVGRSRGNLEAARRAGIVDETSHDLVVAVADADLVVVAAPVDACVDLLARAAAAAPANCVFTDVASVKVPLCAAAVALGIASRFVGAHPIAGGTATGAAAADADLFRGRVVVLTPGADASAAARARVSELWRSTGASVVELDALVHDRVLALTSHLPQMLASRLAALIAEDEEAELAVRLAGPGLRDTTRIAMSDASMWLAIAAANRKQLLTAMDRFTQSWAGLREAIASGDDDALRRMMTEGARLRRRLDKA